MGSSPSDQDHREEESLRRIRITHAFFLGAHEVTRGNFRKFVAESHYETEAERDGTGSFGYSGFHGNTQSPYAQGAEFNWLKPGFEQTDEHPVVNVSWNDASKFCEWLTAKEGKPYRLPTEAEWEYACRSGTTTRWCSGDELRDLHRVANVADQSLQSRNGYFFWSMAWDDGYPFTAPVGKFAANHFGLHDMHGNVWEWCHNWYDEPRSSPIAVDDPQGPKEGSIRTIKGGAWGFRIYSSRSAAREGEKQSYRSSFIGFRVALTASGS